MAGKTVRKRLFSKPFAAALQVTVRAQLSRRIGTMMQNLRTMS
jgi:hypothetical protein